jgi:hypothetical protein
MSLLGYRYQREIFNRARQAKRGRRKARPVLDRLHTWIHDQFKVNVVYVSLEYVEEGPAVGTPRLRVILETDEEVESWKVNPIKIRLGIRRRVLRQLQEFAKDANVSEDLSRTFLILDSFEDACLSWAHLQFHDGPSRKLERKLADLPIWRIDGFDRETVVFLKSEQDIQNAISDGSAERIKRECFNGIKHYDEFNYLSEESFLFKLDSKENLDKTCRGSLYHYWK